MTGIVSACKWCFRKTGRLNNTAQTPIAVKLRRALQSIVYPRFIMIHYSYILLWTIVTSVIIYPAKNVSYTDALFFGCAAATQSGLNTVDLNDMRTYQQVVIYCVPMVTSPIFIHTAVVFVRIYWFEKRFQHLVQSARTIRRTGTVSESSSSDVEQQSSKMRSNGSSGSNGSSLVNDDIAAGTSRRSSDDSAANPQPEVVLEAGSRDETPYLSWNARPGRNSTFIGLNEAQRDELGGIEYRSLKTLAVILISYYLFFHVFGLICLVPWIMRSTKYGPVIRQAGQGRPWWGVFTAGSAFNDFGLTMTPNSMESFQQAAFPLLVMSFLIIIGNTAFPCMLRFIIWILSIVVRRDTPLWDELRFLLDHPRRCFTLLFPQKATWWLFATVIVLNVVNMVVLVVLNVGNTLHIVPCPHMLTSNLPQVGQP